MAPMKEPGRNALSRALRENEGVVTRAQAAGCGLSLGEIRHRIRPGGPWQRLLPGVYLAVTGTPTQRQTEIAALRRAGPGSVLTSIAAWSALDAGCARPRLAIRTLSADR